MTKQDKEEWAELIEWRDYLRVDRWMMTWSLHAYSVQYILENGGMNMTKEKMFGWIYGEEKRNWDGVKEDLQLHWSCTGLRL